MASTEAAVKAGDIIALQNDKPRSQLLGLAARKTHWSHVGIATGANIVLEAVKKKEREFREIDLKGFLDGSTKVKHLIRPLELTPEQTRSLDEFTKSVTQKTSLHSTMTGLPGFLRIFWSIVFCIGSIVLISKTISHPSTFTANFLYLIVLAVIVFILYRFQILSFPSTLGAKATEQLFPKTKIGTLIAEKKQDLFSSKLVLLAEKAIGSDLPAHLPNDAEVQPEHILKACDKLGWLSADRIHLGATAVS